MGIRIRANAPDAEGVGDNDNFCTCKHVNGIMRSSWPKADCGDVYYHDPRGGLSREHHRFTDGR